MKRFGKYDGDFAALFECYGKVNSDVVTERELPSMMRRSVSTTGGESFPGLKRIKVFIQKPGRGADLMHLIKLCLLYTSPSPRDNLPSRMPSSA